MRKIICLLLFLSPMFVHSTQMNIDSLLNRLNTEKLPPAEQLDLYYKISGTYVLYDLDKASEYTEKGLKLAEKENNKLMASKFNGIFGRIYGTKARFDTSMMYLEKALDFAVKAKDQNQEATVYADIGVTYARQNKHTPALEYFLKALSIYEKTGEKKTSIKVMSNIASMYRAIDNDERAIYYLEKAKNIAEETNDVEGKMQVYFELGVIYYKQVMTDHDRKKTEQALTYELKAYELSRKLDHVIYLAATTQALSAIYGDLRNDYDTALQYSRESLQFAQEIGDPEMILGAWNELSNSYRRQKRYKESEAAALNGMEIDTTDVNVGLNLVENILYANIMLGNRDKAAIYVDKYMNVTNKLIDQSNRKILADMEAKYETEKKEMRIATLEKSRKLYVVLGVVAVIVLLLGIGLLFYRNRLAAQKQKLAEQQIQQLEQEQQLIAARSALEAEKLEREIIARDLHDGVGAMLSVVKNNMNIMKSYPITENKKADHFNKALDNLDKSIVELRRVAHHIMPAILMEKGLTAALNDFCHSIPEAEFHYTDPERRFDFEKELVLYRCAYELVNNTLRHAKASRIEVHLTMDKDIAYLSVVDNGCGFDLQTAPQGMGIKNLRIRLSAFGGHMEIYSDPGKGTEANVELPVAAT